MGLNIYKFVCYFYTFYLLYVMFKYCIYMSRSKWRSFGTGHNDNFFIRPPQTRCRKNILFFTRPFKVWQKTYKEQHCVLGGNSGNLIIFIQSLVGPIDGPVPLHGRKQFWKKVQTDHHDATLGDDQRLLWFKHVLMGMLVTSTY